MPYAGGTRGLFRFTEDLGKVADTFTELTKYYVDSRKMFIALSDDGTSGYFSPAAGAILVNMIKNEIETSTLSHQSYADPYKEWKSEMYSGKSYWYRTGALHKAITYLNTAGTKGMVGFDTRYTTHLRQGYGAKVYTQDDTKYSITKVAEMLEFGSTNTKFGMPARPVFSPMTKIFLSNAFPKLVARTEVLLTDLFDSRLVDVTVQKKHREYRLDELKTLMEKALINGEHTKEYNKAIAEINKRL